MGCGFWKRVAATTGGVILVLFVLSGSFSLGALLGSLASGVLVSAIGITVGAFIYRKMSRRAATSDFRVLARAYIISPVVSGLLASLIGGLVGPIAVPVWLSTGKGGDAPDLRYVALMGISAIIAAIVGTIFGAGCGQPATCGETDETMGVPEQ